MKISTTPPRGMRDILPQETEIRDFVFSRILETYRTYGFRHIETPALENIGLLTSGQGGENEKLIFKILKRGEKLDLSSPASADDLVDLGLRFDLTVPLTRYYANNRGQLPRVFKAIQIGSVWRAERPQRGRFRQFTQCDIDIIGVENELCEIELLTATADALLNIGFEDFVIRFNDRRILTDLAQDCGFDESAFEAVFITLDKLDKVGVDGVQQELEASGHPADAIGKLMAVLAALSESPDHAAAKAALPASVRPALFAAVDNVMDAVAAAAGGRYRIVFDPTLVRGMGYYTGQIFEIAYKDYPFSIAGGGRYDKMIGRMIGTDVPACGFSIGFERVITILQEEAMAADTETRRLALIVDPADPPAAAVATATDLRTQGYAASLLPRQKKLGRQIAALKEDGYAFFCVFKPDSAEQAIEAVEAG